MKPIRTTHNRRHNTSCGRTKTTRNARTSIIRRFPYTTNYCPRDDKNCIGIFFFFLIFMVISRAFAYVFIIIIIFSVLKSESNESLNSVHARVRAHTYIHTILLIFLKRKTCSYIIIHDVRCKR